MWCASFRTKSPAGCRVARRHPLFRFSDSGLKMRCSLKRLVLSIGLVVIGAWIVFITISYFFNIRQKSIIRYQLELEMSR